MERDDWITLNILKLFRYSHKKYDWLFTILYNLIPAFVFAPYLIIIGIRENLWVILIVGILLFIVDLSHFITAVRRIK
ncbi:hypothetical protein HOI26_00020 [Candidatus Woesearchaeota archaeon]|jgi:hypothetical protein|nr:hypothetical protein [Candidatus Woesearchaeota archaeon]MBT5739460.1 hypothetical protein [Candidatus Woesearchaeota archaeon]